MNVEPLMYWHRDSPIPDDIDVHETIEVGTRFLMKYISDRIYEIRDSNYKKYNKALFYKEHKKGYRKAPYIDNDPIFMIIQKPDSPLSAVPTPTPNPVSSRPSSSKEGGKRKTRKIKSRRRMSKKSYFK